MWTVVLRIEFRGGGGSGATERDTLTKNGDWWGGRRMVEVNKERSRKRLKQVGREETRIKFVVVATEPRSVAVPVQGWNTTTS